jgi:hypothetical protein
MRTQVRGQAEEFVRAVGGHVVARAGGLDDDEPLRSHVWAGQARCDSFRWTKDAHGDRFQCDQLALQSCKGMVRQVRAWARASTSRRLWGQGG